MERKLSTEGLSLYQTLGLSKGATPEEIKKAYRVLALRNHPDKNPDDPNAAAKIREINFANGVLSDLQKKEIYDAYGSLGLNVADQIGTENMHAYALFNNKCFKACFCICGLLTGCYCCLCCCCCCRIFRKPSDQNADINLNDPELGTPPGFHHNDSSPHTEQPR